MADPTPAPLAKVSRPRLYEQIVEQLTEHIRASGLRPGDRLPPERELAASLGVSRTSLTQALVALEVLGVVSVRHGDGVVVQMPPAHQQLVQALRAHRSRLPEVIEARSAMEVKLADLAARRRTEQDLAAIEASLTEMTADIEAGGRGTEADEHFHAAVTAAAHSPLLGRLMAEISGLIRQTRLESLAQPGRPAVSLAGHRAVADAIRAQDPAAAAEAMREHIEVVSDVALLRDPADRAG